MFGVCIISGDIVRCVAAEEVAREQIMRNRFDSRDRIIEETSAWLTWAITGDIEVPRIPCRRVDRGGFDALRRLPNSRVLMDMWWHRTWNVMENM